MKAKFFILSALLLTFVSCERSDEQNRNRSLKTEDVDNTARNVRDRDSNAITPLNQGENEMDRKITQEIRKSIMADKELSTNAKNVKVVSMNGVVTLRGVVNSDEEKVSIGQKASSVSGTKQVENLLEVKEAKQ